MVTSSGKIGFDGARAFSRLMTWICLTLSVTTACAVLAVVALILIFDTSQIIPCSNVAIGRPPIQANFTCGVTVPTKRVTETTLARANGRETSRHTTTTTTGRNPVRANPSDLALPLLMTPPLLLAAALWQAGGFFRQLFKGWALSAVTVRRLRNFSVLGMLFLVLNPMMPDLAKAIMAPFHLQPATLTWGSSDIFGWKATVSDLLNLIFAATLIAMVSVLARAAAIAEDHAQIV